MYVIDNGWKFILDIIYPPFDVGYQNGFLVINSIAKKDGTVALQGISVNDVLDGNVSGIGYKEKCDYIKRLLPLIPRYT